MSPSRLECCAHSFQRYSHFGAEGPLTELIINDTAIGDGEAYFAVYVDRPKGSGQPIVADLVMDLVGPVTPDRLVPRRLSGFELPALELIHMAQKRAAEAGVRKILLVDPQGLVTLAKINRYAPD